MKTYRFLLLSLAALGIVAAGFYLILYLQTELHGALVAGIVLFLIFSLTPLVDILVKRGKYFASGILVLIGVWIAYGVNEWVWSGLTVYHLVGGLLLISISTGLALPRRWLIWLIAVAAYFGYTFLVNTFDLYPRYDASTNLALNTFAIIVNIFLGLVTLILITRFVQGRPIRTRLVLAFLLLVLIPTVVTSAAVNILVRRSSQQQAVNQLYSVATLKEAEIKAWMESLEPNLYIAITQQARLEQQWMVETLARDYPSTQVLYLDIYNRVKNRFDQTIEQGDIFAELFLMNLDGTVVLSTDPDQEGANKQEWPFFEQGLKGSYVNPPFMSPDTGELSIVASVPFQNQNNEIIAVVGGRVNIQRLNQIMVERAGLGTTGETYLVSPEYILMTETRFDFDGKNIQTEGALNAISKNLNGSGSYTNYLGEPVIGVYQWIPDLQVSLLAEQSQAEVFQPINEIMYAYIAAALLSLLIALLVAVYVTQRIIQPLTELSVIAQRIAAGDLSLAAEVKQEDEIGTLSKSFNLMTSQLRNLIGSLEQRVAERTQALERRSLQLRTAAEVARDASHGRNLDDLINGAVNMIRDRFGFYHAGIFLVDHAGEYAILRAATGEAGRKMLQAGHKLKVGETGIVGFVTSIGEARVAHDVGADAAHFRNPLLPSTRSEVALPLIVAERIIGALDVQSVQEAAFDNESVEVLQTMTDQLAVAIENVRLLQEMERSMKELEAAYGRYTVESWKDFFKHTSQVRGYRYRGLGLEPITEISPQSAEAWRHDNIVLSPEPPDQDDDGHDNYTTVAVPMRLRDQIIGVVNVRVRGEAVPKDTIGFFEEIVNRLALALDNVRLLGESQLRSEQIRLLQEITAAAVATVNLQELLQATARKIREGFGLNYCGVVLLESEKQFGDLVVDDHSDTNLTDMCGMRLPVDKNEAIQELIRTRKSTRQYDVQNNPSTALIHDFLKIRGTHVMLLVPLLSRGEVIGFITMETAEISRQYDDDELLLADQISLQVSTAIDVARSFEQTEQRAAREQLTREITARIRETLDMDTMLETAVREIGEAFGIAEVEVRLGDEGALANLSLLDEERRENGRNGGTEASI